MLKFVKNLFIKPKLSSELIIPKKDSTFSDSKESLGFNKKNRPSKNEHKVSKSSKTPRLIILYDTENMSTDVFFNIPAQDVIDWVDKNPRNKQERPEKPEVSEIPKKTIPKLSDIVL